MKFPKNIRIPSDDTELELVEVNTIAKTKETVGTYKYTKAIHHLNSHISWSEEAFERNVKKGIITF